MAESIAFSDLTTFVSNSVEAGTYIFQLPELHDLYVNRLKQLGFSKSINKTRLKQQFLEHFMEAKEETDGKKVLLVFREGMKEILKDAVKERDFSEDALILAKPAKILRNDIFNHQPFKFDNEFTPHCQENSLPTTLKWFILQTLFGCDSNFDKINESQACLSICQLILFNAKKRQLENQDNQGRCSRHSSDREPSLPIYNIHVLSRSRKLI